MYTLKRYTTIWLITAINAVQETFVNRGSNALFLFGKCIRFVMTLVFLLLLKQNTATFGSYTTDQAIVFFLTYNILDVVAQVVYRGVYLFSNHIKEGSFDFMLIKPVNPLFQSLMGKPDINDVFFLLPSIIASFWIASTLNIEITLTSALVYALLLLNGFLIATALHIAILALAIYTTDVSNIVWLYRDFMQLGRFPVSIYMPALKFVLFFIIPVGAMITVPAQALLGLPLSLQLSTTGLIGVGSIIASVAFWRQALKAYSSASS